MLPSYFSVEGGTNNVHDPPESMDDDEDDVKWVHAVGDDIWVQPKSQLRIRLCNKLTHVVNLVQSYVNHPQPRLTLYDVWRHVSGSSYDKAYIPTQWSPEDKTSLQKEQ